VTGCRPKVGEAGPPWFAAGGSRTPQPRDCHTDELRNRRQRKKPAALGAVAAGIHPVHAGMGNDISRGTPSWKVGPAGARAEQPRGNWTRCHRTAGGPMHSEFMCRVPRCHGEPSLRARPLWPAAKGLWDAGRPAPGVAEQGLRGRIRNGRRIGQFAGCGTWTRMSPRRQRRPFAYSNPIGHRSSGRYRKCRCRIQPRKTPSPGRKNLCDGSSPRFRHRGYARPGGSLVGAWGGGGRRRTSGNGVEVVVIFLGGDRS